MLDLGANSDCSPEQLLQFAVMGASLATAMQGLARPRVALLNIGEEEIKGNEVIKQAAQLLQASQLNYAGFVEGDGVFLRDFVADGVQWAHVDVAGPAYNTGGAYGYTAKGGTGVPVRTMAAVLADIAEEG